MGAKFLEKRNITPDQAVLILRKNGLRTYCDTNDIHIKDIYREDCSAKTFDRPVSAKLLVS